MNGAPRATVFATATSLTFTLLAEDLARAGKLAVTVKNPKNDRGSAAKEFEVTA